MGGECILCGPTMMGNGKSIEYWYVLGWWNRPTTVNGVTTELGTHNHASTRFFSVLTQAANQVYS